MRAFPGSAANALVLSLVIVGLLLATGGPGLRLPSAPPSVPGSQVSNTTAALGGHPGGVSASINCTYGNGYTQLTANTQVSWAGHGDPSGYAPLNVSWTAYVNGGLPPYNITLSVNLSPGGGVIGRGPTGSYSFTRPGIFYVDLSVRDAAPDCQTLNQGAFQVDVWGAGGPNPVHINATTLSGTVPLNDSFSLTVVGLSGPFTATWSDGYGSLGVGSRINDTFWSPTHEDPVGACVTNATGALFACGVVYVNVTGIGILNLSVSPANGTSPYVAHAWMNLTRLDQIPGPAQLEYEWQGYVGPNSSYGWVPVTLNLTPSPSNRSYEANTTLSTPYDVPAYGSFVAGIVVGTRILALSYGDFVVQPANGSLASPEPVLSYSISPSSGPAPLTVTIMARGNGGTSPYPRLGFGTVGAGTPDPNGRREPAWWANVSNWSGPTVHVVHTFSTSGNFTVIGELWDGVAGSSIVLASVTVTAPAILSPLSVVPRVVGAASSDGTTRFVADVSGGMPPYTVQWQFGDGSVGSSVPDVEMTHQFPGPGTYYPEVSVRDGRGVWVNSSVPAVTLPGTSPLASVGGLPPFPYDAWAGSALIAGAACVIGPLLFYRHREKIRREGEQLVDDLAPGGMANWADGPGRPPGA
jgi:hypothetical protein